MAHHRKGSAPAADPARPPCTKVSDALLLELQKLNLVDTYEGQIALGLAAQLDDGSVKGAAYVSLSKEVDRRVAALRLKAERPDDPVKLRSEAVDARRANLRLA